MSKKSPSIAQTLEPVQLVDSTRDWTRRVFHNTYTYKGKCRAVRGWSVKFQHEGRRKTISLTARTQELAAAEAERIHLILRKEGWDAVLQLSERNRTFFEKTDIRYWKGRLHFRKYGSSTEIAHCSALIENEGHGYYFRLDRTASDRAAAKALDIYKCLLKEGWDGVRRRHTYEVTIALRWSAEPLLWSYTTLHTMSEPCRSERRPGTVAIIESRPELRNALVRLVSRDLRRACLGYQDPEAWLAAGSKDTLLCIVNAELAERLLPGAASQLTRLANGTYVLPYSAHVDSDDLFLAAPGGRSAYCYKRLPPSHMIYAVLGSLDCLTSEQSASHAVQVFFNSPARIPTNPQAATPRSATFTRRESEVLALLSKGFVDKEIARALGISTWTVHEHVKRIFEKLGVHSRIEATLAYLQK